MALLLNQPNVGDRAELSPLTHFVQMHADGPASAQRMLADLELLLRSRRVHAELIKSYNPLAGLAAAERVRATARRVGLDVPEMSSHRE